ncbi:MAG: P-II family nitrogen regulator [Burkholderiaceae bacterium]|jgi:nitrogen regulatory protein P-II 2
MDMYDKKLVVILAESALEPKLAKAVMKLGAHGYTVSDARGQGRHGHREASWSADGTIRMEIICDAPTSEAIAADVHRQFFQNYAISLYVSDVRVLRADKY